jgi:hypothetical protein
MFVYFFYREISNGILEVISIRGWFLTNCQLFVYIHILSFNKLAASEAESSPVILLMILAGQMMLLHPAINKSNTFFATASDNFRQQSIRKNLHMK